MQFKLKENKWLVGLIALLVVVAAVLFSPKISLDTRLLQLGKKLQSQRKFLEAAEEYERVVNYAQGSPLGLEAARLGGNVSLYDLKDYSKAVFFFRHIVRVSQATSERKWAQERLAEIYYEKLNNYSQAIIEYNRLLEANPSKDESEVHRVRIARAYYYLANFEQAIVEAERLVQESTNNDRRFEMYCLKADAYLAQKKPDEAIKIYNEIEQKFSDHPEIYRININKSVAYEDKQDWDRAIKELESIKNSYPHPDIINLKIKNIIKRKTKKKDL